MNFLTVDCEERSQALIKTEETIQHNRMISI